MDQKVKLLNKYLVLGLVPATLYVIIEILFRGYSHISMFCLAFFLGITLGGINEWLPWEMSLLKQMFIGAVWVTCLEGLTGLVVNVWLGLHVWDYSSMPFTFLHGQICLPFSIAWFFLSGVAIVLDDYLRYWFFGEEKPHYYLRTKR